MTMRCMHPGCRAEPGRLMCWPHWLARPPHLRGARLTPAALRRELVEHIKLSAVDARVVERAHA